MTNKPWHYALILTCALLASLPLFQNGPSCGHDFDFHLQSWLAANSAWQHGLSNPHWLPSANYGAGEPRFIFYPPLSWTLGALLGAALPWTLVPQILTLLALAACGAAFYALASRWVHAPIAAVAACIYLADPYLLFVAYERTAYGELLAATAIPLIVLYALRPRPAILRLALAVAALWFTNAPAAVMGCYLLLLCATLAALHARSLIPAVRSLVSLALGTGLASVYVLPAWYEQRWVEIARVVGPGMRVEDSFLFGHTGEPFHDQVLHTASLIAVAVLAAGLLCAAASALALRATLPLERGSGRSSERGPERGSQTLARAELSPVALPVALVTTTLLAILLLLLPASEPVWHFAPQLHFLQFPWRWLLVASLAATLAGALAAELFVRRRPGQKAPAWTRRGGWIVASAALAISAAAGHYAGHTYFQSCDEQDNVTAQLLLPLPPAPDADTDLATHRAQLPGAAAPIGFEGTDEYTPNGSDNGEIQRGLPAVRLIPAPQEDEGDDSAAPNPAWKAAPSGTSQVRIKTWTEERKSFLVTTSSRCYAVLRLLDYPAWQVRLNDRPLTGRPHREDGLLTIPLPAGTNSVAVTYQATPDIYAGRAVSLFSFVVFAAIGSWSRLRKRHP